MNRMKKKIITVSGIDDLAQNAASYIQQTAQYEIQKKGFFTLVLSGGRTPEALYRKLATPDFAGKINWEHVNLFWGDERYVPYNHPESNYRMAFHTLIQHVPIPQKNIFPIRTNAPSPQQAAAMYEKSIRDFFTSNVFNREEYSTKEIPSFDLVLLGMGVDGHTAALYNEKHVCMHEKWVIAVDAPQQYSITRRITLTLPVINHSRRVVFLVSGPEKRQMLETVLDKKDSSNTPPAKMVRSENELVWLTDIPVL